MSREPLTRERALAAAVALADAEGLRALTMRRLAAEVGVEAMSLYYHLPGKEGLLDGLAESVIAEITAAVGKDRHPDWRTSIRHRFLAAREVMLRHPWAPGLISARPSIPPAVYAYYDAIIGTLLEAGFPASLAHRAIHAFGTMTLGFVPELFGVSAGDTAEEELSELATTLPNLTAMVAAELHAVGDPTLGWCDSQGEFEFTLDLLLDGLERARRGVAGKR